MGGMNIRKLLPARSKPLENFETWVPYLMRHISPEGSTMLSRLDTGLGAIKVATVGNH